MPFNISINNNDTTEDAWHDNLLMMIWQFGWSYYSRIIVNYESGPGVI